jgi:hypothetical protein
MFRHLSASLNALSADQFLKLLRDVVADAPR